MSNNSVDLESKDNYDLLRNISIFVLGLICLFGTFSPWVTVAGIFNITGNKSEWGLSTFLIFIIYSLYSASGLMINSKINQINYQLRKISIIASIIVISCLTYILIRFIVVVNDYNQEITNSQNELDNADTGFLGDAFSGFVEQLAEAIKPRVGIGFIACYLSVITGLILTILVKNPFLIVKKQNLLTHEEPVLSIDVPRKREETTIKLRKPSLKIIKSVLGIMILLFIILFAFKFGEYRSEQKTNKSAESNQENSKMVQDQSENLEKIVTPSPSIIEKASNNVNKSNIEQKSKSEKSKITSSAESDMPIILAPTITKIGTGYKILILNWSPIYDSDGQIISNYNFRWRTSSTGKVTKGQSCTFNSSELVYNANMQCTLPFTDVPQDLFDRLFDEKIKFFFSLQAVSDDGVSDWGKEYEFDFSLHPELRVS